MLHAGSRPPWAAFTPRVESAHIWGQHQEVGRRHSPQALVGAAPGAFEAQGQAASPPGAGIQPWLAWEQCPPEPLPTEDGLEQWHAGAGTDPELRTDCHEDWVPPWEMQLPPALAAACPEAGYAGRM